MYVKPSGRLRDLLLERGHQELLDGFEIHDAGFETIHADIKAHHPAHMTDEEKHALAVYATFHHPDYKKPVSRPVEAAPVAPVSITSPAPINVQPAPVIIHPAKPHIAHWVQSALLLLILLVLCAGKAHCQSGGVIVQGQNSGTILFTRASGFFALNCAGTLGCSFANNVMTLTGGGAGGTMTNPLTTQYDIVYAGNTASPATPVRLGLGANGTALGASGGVLGYYTIPTLLGFTPIQLSSLSASSPITYNNTSGAIGWTNSLNYITLGSISANSPLSYNNSTGAFSCPTCSTVGFANPMTTLGDVLYGGASGAATRLAGDTSNSRKFFRSLSSGGVAAAPAWDLLQSSDIPNNAANTSGNAATATALASAPSQCSSGQYSTGIATSGNANCAQVAYSQLSSAPTIFYQTFQHDTTAVTQRAKFNLAAGSNITISASDNGTDTTTFTVAASGSVGSTFDTISTGTNTSATMTVGSGATLTYTSTGVVNANELAGSLYKSGTLIATVGTVVDGDCAQAGAITISGAALGDPVFAGVNLNLPSGVNAIAKVTGSNTVNVEVCNLSESSQTIGSATYKVALLH